MFFFCHFTDVITQNFKNSFIDIKLINSKPHTFKVQI